MNKQDRHHQADVRRQEGDHQWNSNPRPQPETNTPGLHNKISA